MGSVSESREQVEEIKVYEAAEARVAKWFSDKGIGGGDDPVGSLIASHEALAAELRAMKAAKAG
jgi:hypothetical protein